MPVPGAMLPYPAPGVYVVFVPGILLPYPCPGVYVVEFIDT